MKMRNKSILNRIIATG